MSDNETIVNGVVIRQQKELPDKETGPRRSRGEFSMPVYLESTSSKIKFFAIAFTMYVIGPFLYGFYQSFTGMQSAYIDPNIFLQFLN